MLGGRVVDYKHYYRNAKSGALAYVSPPTSGRRLYFHSREDYISTLIKITMLSIEQLNRAGYNAKLIIDTTKQN